ncbi:MAG: leucine-rich repeat domain-containing protein, partial [Nitrospiraceae bacterium]
DLQKLYLGNNQLTGTIPSDLGNLINLVELDVSYNQLFGSIPSTFEGLQALVTFDVTGNCLVDFAPVQSPLNDVPNLIGNTESCECISDDTRVTTCGLGACEGNTGEETCVDGFWDGGTDTCDPLAGAAAETCDNADNDCDGSTDEDLTQPTTCGVGACAGNAGIETCAAGAWGGDTCDPFEGAVADNTCNGLDENCDGTPDDGYVATPTLCGVGACSANGQIECQSGTPVNTCTPETPLEEICGDDIDQDCDGDDLICTDSDGDGVADNIDNCPNQQNANQSDIDNDGIGDVCDNVWFVIPLPDNKGAVIFNL